MRLAETHHGHSCPVPKILLIQDDPDTVKNICEALFSAFMQQDTTNPGESTIVSAVIAMGRSLRLRAVAEGVETLEQLMFHRALQCDEAQVF